MVYTSKKKRNYAIESNIDRETDRQTDIKIDRQTEMHINLSIFLHITEKEE